jgi:methyl-accepting chemotaxis protein
VRNLAQRSAEAAKNTAAMIEESVKRANNGVEISGAVSEALEEIVGGTTKVSTLLNEITSSVTEQADGIGQVNKGVTELDKVTQSNAGNAEELASAAEETAAQVQSLRALVGQFRVSDHQRSSADTRTATAQRQNHQQRAAAGAGSSGTRTTSKATSSDATSSAGDARQVIPLNDDEDFESF